jgi:pyridoxal biosynthesis lyase PdxS
MWLGADGVFVGSGIFKTPTWVYVAKDGSEACISLRAYCAQNGAAREVKLELEFKRYETYEEKIREVYRPKGLLAYTTAAREYVRIL